MIGILFGAGASFGSQNHNAPPLGSDLYASIKDMDVGPRREIKKEAHECLSIHDYLSPANTKITQSISIDEWVTSISKDSKEYFEIGDFERGLSTLTKRIKEDRENRKSLKGTSFMVPGNDQLDISLPEKIMGSSTFHVEFTRIRMGAARR